MDDAAIARAINLHDFIIQDLNTPRTSILLAQAASARLEAIEATKTLLAVDPHDWKAVQAAQNEVRRYVELAAWLQDATHAAREIYASLPADEQAEILAFLAPKQEKVNDA
jgi:hypothetical protein